MLLEKLIRTFFSAEFIRYVIVGLVSVAIEMAILILLVEWTKMSYLQSNVLAFLITSVINYALNRLWVFEKTGRRKRVEFIMFAVLVGISLVISQVLMYIGVDLLHLDYKISKLISIGIVVTWSFLIRKNFVFAKRSLKPDN